MSADTVSSPLTEMISFGSCPTCNSIVQVIGGTSEPPRYVEAGKALLLDAMQEDIAALLRAVGLPDHARNASPHQVMIEEIIPAVERGRRIEDAARRLVTPKLASSVFKTALVCNEDFIALRDLVAPLEKLLAEDSR